MNPKKNFQLYALILVFCILAIYVYLQYRTIQILDDVAQVEARNEKIIAQQKRDILELSEMVETLERQALPWWKKLIQDFRERHA